MKTYNNTNSLVLMCEIFSALVYGPRPNSLVPMTTHHCLYTAYKHSLSCYNAYFLQIVGCLCACVFITELIGLCIEWNTKVTGNKILISYNNNNNNYSTIIIILAYSIDSIP